MASDRISMFGAGNGNSPVAQDLTTDGVTPATLALHNNFRTSVQALRRDIVRTIHYLTAIHQRKVHRALGFATITDYAAAVAGFTRNQTETFLALGRRLEKFPEVRRALAEGELTWSKAQLIVDRAEPVDERRWVDAARRLGVEAMRTELNKRDKREALPKPAPENRIPLPAPPLPRSATRPRSPRPSLSETAPLRGPVVPCHIRYALTPEQYARWSSLHETLRKEGRQGSNADLLLEALAALAAGEGSPAAGPGYLLVVHQCPDCGSGELPNARGRFEAPRALLEAVMCDSVCQRQDGTRRATIPPRLRRVVLARDDHRCCAEGCNHTNFLEIHHRVPAAQGGNTEPNNLVTLCSRCHRALHRNEAELREAGRDPVG